MNILEADQRFCIDYRKAVSFESYSVVKKVLHSWEPCCRDALLMTPNICQILVTS